MWGAVSGFTEEVERGGRGDEGAKGKRPQGSKNTGLCCVGFFFLGQREKAKKGRKTPVCCGVLVWRVQLAYICAKCPWCVHGLYVEMTGGGDFLHRRFGSRGVLDQGGRLLWRERCFVYNTHGVSSHEGGRRSTRDGNSIANHKTIKRAEAGERRWSASLPRVCLCGWEGGCQGQRPAAPSSAAALAHAHPLEARLAAAHPRRRRHVQLVARARRCRCCSCCC
jgi:hypothetical protein